MTTFPGVEGFGAGLGAVDPEAPVGAPGEVGVVGFGAGLGAADPEAPVGAPGEVVAAGF